MKLKRPFLVNAVEQNRRYPKTFEIPDTSDVTLGSIVKVSDNQERFWVKVTCRCGDVLTGMISNELLGKKLAFGDMIQFHVDNIHAIWKEAE